MHSATYSPQDDKLRLYPAFRLDPDEYARVKAAGFGWAPKQECFFAVWTPEREDVVLTFVEEIDDETMTREERAAAREERFETYSENRKRDAERASAGVAAIADNIPLGQPILVGHHSERHARRDQQRIENGMRKAVQNWRTADYWKQRARAVERHADRLERADVRARRIRGLESDLRKQQAHLDNVGVYRRVWSAVIPGGSPFKSTETTPEAIRDRAMLAANERAVIFGIWSELRDGKITPEEAVTRSLEQNDRNEERAKRWLDHINGRLEYERARLAEDGGTEADKIKPEKGGGCKCWASPRGGWSTIQKVNKVSVTVLDNYGNGGKNFTRTIPFDKLSGLLSKADVDAARADGRLVDSADGIGFYVTPSTPPPPPPKPEPAPVNEQRQAIEAALKAGVQVVTSPDLFPTPPDLARRMVELADLDHAHTVLEPSAGTGAIWREMIGKRTAVEINPKLAEALRGMQSGLHDWVICKDFFTCNGDLGTFDRIVMNPPFSGGADVKHIQHALTMLKPGGRLVALCAAGPRQEAALRPLASSWEVIEGAFKDQGTGVRVALLTIDRQ